MTFPADLPNLGGNAIAARSRRDRLVAGHDGRMFTETFGRPLLRAQQAAQTYRAAAQAAELDQRGAPNRCWLRSQSALCHQRARITADEAALAAERDQPAQARAWAALADRYATAARHLARPAFLRRTAITNLHAAAAALDARALPVPAQAAAEEAPLSGIAQFSVTSGRQALAAARRAEGPVLKHVNTVEVELLLFACYAQGQNEVGYHVAMQAVRALNRARKTAPEGQAEDMDPQPLTTAYELAEQALDAAEAATAPTP
ncbi:hypothetical protein [Streptomyces candidus]|uniref:Uncharacterized protein n=1 Tax=Streptomyces candidus TaxID=67283 RepID=A0A7X0HME9_9ACTN|nr:hypothetical protein [Streptomyces candidus]MBB6440246.1 hypothetical protein [Streptomyces candidus]GHH57763.1 hypothetical protein GCM10018773_65600 [Streptomyces candidus]